MTWILENLATITAIVTAAMTLASLIVGLTPTPKDDAALKTVRQFLIRLSILNPSDVRGLFKAPLSKVD
jgi:hypothetical protein